MCLLKLDECYFLCSTPGRKYVNTAPNNALHVEIDCDLLFDERCVHKVMTYEPISSASIINPSRQ
jgi:hypothetical protein